MFCQKDCFDSKLNMIGPKSGHEKTSWFVVLIQTCSFLKQKLELDRFMLYAHGPDLCRESDLRHAMANCFEALIGEFDHQQVEQIIKNGFLFL